LAQVSIPHRHSKTGMTHQSVPFIYYPRLFIISFHFMWMGSHQQGSCVQDTEFIRSSYGKYSEE
jgi:hypothetical protein